MPKPTNVVGFNHSNWPRVIDSGNVHSVAIGDTGGVFVCGSAVLGRIAHLIEDSKMNTKRFQKVTHLTQKFTDVACGDYHTVCLSDDGLLWSWGGA